MKKKINIRIMKQMLKRIIYPVFLLPIICMNMEAQDYGQVSFNGYTLNIPENWAGVQQDDIYLMASETEAGIIVLVPAAFTDQAGIESELNNEQTDGASISLKRAEPIENLGNNVMGAKFQGIFNYEEATMYVSGVVREGSRGMLVFSGTTSQKYSDRYRELALQIVNSMKADVAAASAQNTSGAASSRNDWESFYGDTRLTYMDSYYSSGYGGASVSGGYSNTVVIDLCSKGYFTYSNSFNLSGGSDYSSFGRNDAQQGSGTWSIVPKNDQYATLILKYHNGTTETYEMHYDEKGRTYLNQDRYFRTTSNDSVEEHRPSCY